MVPSRLVNAARKRCVSALICARSSPASTRRDLNIHVSRSSPTRRVMPASCRPICCSTAAEPALVRPGDAPHLGQAQHVLRVAHAGRRGLAGVAVAAEFRHQRVADVGLHQRVALDQAAHAQEAPVGLALDAPEAEAQPSVGGGVARRDPGARLAPRAHVALADVGEPAGVVEQGAQEVGVGVGVGEPAQAQSGGLEDQHGGGGRVQGCSSAGARADDQRLADLFHQAGAGDRARRRPAGVSMPVPSFHWCQ